MYNCRTGSKTQGLLLAFRGVRVLPMPTLQRALSEPVKCTSRPGQMGMEKARAEGCCGGGRRADGGWPLEASRQSFWEVGCSVLHLSRPKGMNIEKK